jgi:hypothetical protein
VRKHDRGSAKTTFALAPVEDFADLRSLIQSLPDDELMASQTETSWDFGRIEAERRNVRVVAYIFAIGKESDNDFHMILDDDGILDQGAKLNAEISGIATEGPDIETLQQMRDGFKAYFGGNPPRKYQPFLDPPLHVAIEGSLFFDRDHPAGAVGPEGFRPGSAWEIHPVRRITVLRD